MAERRMFAKTIIDSDAFLEMPLSAQALYFHLSMRADDDGFVNNPKRIQRTVGGNDDDYKLLLAKNFILAFDSGIIVIKHWKIHNYIRGDRKKDTNYPEEMAMLAVKENGAYTFKNPSVETIPDNSTDYRKRAYEESSLPYSFDYKIRHAFFGKPCPICGALMRGTVDECGIGDESHLPTIQHNVPLSKGGRHELGNISVICHKCNVTIRDNVTEDLNADEVIQAWDEISGCQSSDSHMSGICQADVSIGKDSIGKNRLDKENIYNNGDSEARKSDINKFFDRIWKAYPKKKGKGQISDAKKRYLYEKVGEEQLLRCINRYKEYIAGKDEQYVMYGSTFFNSGYVDYLDEEPEEEPVKEPRREGFEDCPDELWNKLKDHFDENGLRWEEITLTESDIRWMRRKGF